MENDINSYYFRITLKLATHSNLNFFIGVSSTKCVYRTVDYLLSEHGRFFTPYIKISSSFLQFTNEKQLKSTHRRLLNRRYISISFLSDVTETPSIFIITIEHNNNTRELRRVQGNFLFHLCFVTLCNKLDAWLVFMCKNLLTASAV